MATPMTRTDTSWRRIGFWAATGLALVVVAVGLGEILLFGVVGWLDTATLESVFPGAEPHRIHGLGHGLVAWMLILSIGAQLWRPSKRFAAAVFGLTVLSIYTLAALLSGMFDGLELVGIAALATMVGLHPGRPDARLTPLRPLTIALAAPIVVGALLYGGAELQAQLSAAATDPHALIGHFGIMAALAASTALAVVIGASSMQGSALVGWLGVAAAVAFGLASVLFPASASSLGAGVGLGLLVATAACAIGLLTTGGQRSAPAEVGPQRQAT